MESIKRKYPHVAVQGYDIFDWSKQYADPLVKEQVQIVDLRQKLNPGRQFDIVNCTEVGEHIDKEYEQVFWITLPPIAGNG